MDILNTKIKQILTEKSTKIKPENIKSGINILGVQGSSKVLDTTDANAVSNDIVTGKTAYVNGQKLIGSYTGIIPSGSINIIQNGTTDVSQYASANVNVPAIIYPPDWSKIGYSNTPQSLLNSFVYSKNIYDNWDTSITSGNDMFREDKNLRYFPTVSTSNITSMYRMFSYSNLEEIPLIDTSNVKDVRYMFAGCTILVTVPILNLSEATLLASMFTSCVSLSNESLNNIMKICISATAYTGTKTLKILGLTSEQATTCQTLSNYQDFLNAGWTIGY